MPRIVVRSLALAAAALVLVYPARTRGQAADVGIRIAVTAASVRPGVSSATALAELRVWDSQLTALERAGALTQTSAEPDTLVPGRVHQRFAQEHQGVRVFGAGLARQVNQFGQAESIFGTYYPDVGIGTTPAVDIGRASSLLAAAGGGRVWTTSADRVELVILPFNGVYRLVWTGRVRSSADGWIRRVFIDAATGETVWSYDDTWTQTPAVGKGQGVTGDTKKVSAVVKDKTFEAVDALRPYGTSFTSFDGANVTYDYQGNVFKFLNATLPDAADVATDDDNIWINPPVVDAHAHAGFTYDYYFQRFGRKGLDNANLQISSETNVVRPEDWIIYFNTSLFGYVFLNAAYMGGGMIYYGSGLPPGVTFQGQEWSNLGGALDVVAHELSHGVTSYSSGLQYLNESGALNEAFSDMMGQSAQFFFHPPADAGASPDDWALGEEVIRPGGLRNMAQPFQRFGDPDHYSIRFIGTTDGGGVHTNSSIVNHMFYLAVMGGTNRVSGLSVQGVGFANREQIEKTIYRGFTQMLTPSANFSSARAATIQTARDLYGAGSAAETAITQAWTAVGVS